MSNDEFIDSKQKKEWQEVEKRFVLIYSEPIKIALSKIDLTYEYIEHFIEFAKNYDDRICMTALPKNERAIYMSYDIDACLNRFGKTRDFPLYYVEYKFASDYRCKHGSDFKDVYLVFAAIDDLQIVTLLKKFKQLKAFL